MGKTGAKKNARARAARAVTARRNLHDAFGSKLDSDVIDAVFDSIVDEPQQAWEKLWSMVRGAADGADGSMATSSRKQSHSGGGDEGAEFAAAIAASKALADGAGNAADGGAVGAAHVAAVCAVWLGGGGGDSGEEEDASNRDTKSPDPRTEDADVASDTRAGVAAAVAAAGAGASGDARDGTDPPPSDPAAAWALFVDMFGSDVAIDDLLRAFEAHRGDIVAATDAVLASDSDAEANNPGSGRGAAVAAATALASPAAVAPSTLLPPRSPAPAAKPEATSTPTTPTLVVAHAPEHWPVVGGGDARSSHRARLASGPFGGGPWRKQATDALVTSLARTVDKALVDEVMAAHHGDDIAAVEALHAMFPEEMSSARAITRTLSDDRFTESAKENAAVAATTVAAATRPDTPVAPRGSPSRSRSPSPGGGSSPFIRQWFRDDDVGGGDGRASAGDLDARMREHLTRAARAYRSNPSVAGEYARRARELRAQRNAASHDDAASIMHAHNPRLSASSFSGRGARFPAIDCHGLTVDNVLLLARQLISHGIDVGVREFTIITGVGHHTAGGVSRARLRPTMHRFLKSAGVTYSEDSGVFKCRFDPRTVRV